jgi:hypothetical protein
VSDVFDIFASEPLTFRASLWLYNSTKGVIALGGLFSSEEAAQTALRAYTELPDLEFSPLSGDGQSHANTVWKNRWNRAIVTRSSGQVISEAEVPDGWFPPGDPRRKVRLESRP